MKHFTTCPWHYFDDAKTCLIVGLELLHFTFFTAKPLQGKHIWNSSSCHQGQTTPCSSFYESPVSHVFILICKLLSSRNAGVGYSRASPGIPVFNIAKLWSGGNSLRQSLQKCRLTESVRKGLEMSTRKLSCTRWVDSGAALSPCAFRRTTPQSRRAH